MFSEFRTLNYSVEPTAWESSRLFWTLKGRRKKIWILKPEYYFYIFYTLYIIDYLIISIRIINYK